MWYKLYTRHFSFSDGILVSASDIWQRSSSTWQIRKGPSKTIFVTSTRYKKYLCFFVLLHFTPPCLAGKNGLLQLSSGHKLHRSSHHSISIKPSSLSPIHHIHPHFHQVSPYFCDYHGKTKVSSSLTAPVFSSAYTAQSPVSWNLDETIPQISYCLILSSRRQPWSAAMCLPGPLCSKQRLGMAAEATTTMDIMRNMANTTMLTTLQLPQWVTFAFWFCS